MSPKKIWSHWRTFIKGPHTLMIPFVCLQKIFRRREDFSNIVHSFLSFYVLLIFYLSRNRCTQRLIPKSVKWKYHPHSKGVAIRLLTVNCFVSFHIPCSTPRPLFQMNFLVTGGTCTVVGIKAENSNKELLGRLLYVSVTFWLIVTLFSPKGCKKSDNKVITFIRAR